MSFEMLNEAPEGTVIKVVGVGGAGGNAGAASRASGADLAACSAAAPPQTPSPAVTALPTPSASTTAPADSEITVTWLAVAGAKGATGTTVISRRQPGSPGDFRVEFSENEVGGIGSQSQAGAWNAAIISTLLLGILAMMVVGGLGSIPGAVLGAVILLGLPEVLRPIGDYRMIVVGAVMFFSILFLPRGLLGETSVLAVFRKQFGLAWDTKLNLGWRQ